ncbi:reverse transcriptase domain-containing protein [Tanacetum coccineum]|uniref:Reverse transcriptase domain-containing protein n=1 Tax=Tanacetum coccineum TaxID=301880 RepID=A0ABQ4XYB9_9ASTR
MVMGKQDTLTNVAVGLKKGAVGLTNVEDGLTDVEEVCDWLTVGAEGLTNSLCVVGRGGRGRGPKGCNDEGVDELNGQGNDQGLGANRGVDGVNRNVEGVNKGVFIEGFLACNPKEYDGKGDPTLILGSWHVSMSWNEFKCMMIQEFCPSHEMKKLESELWNHAMVGAGHAAYTNRFYELARLVPHLVTRESRMIERYVCGLASQIRGMVATTEPKSMQKAVQIYGALTDEAVRNGSIKKVKNRGNVGEPSKDRSRRDANKRTRTVNAFATTVNPDCRSVPRNVNLANARNPHVRACYECGSTDHVRPACSIWNRVQGPGGNCPNQVVANNEGQGRGNQGNQARGRAFMLGAEEARQDPNIMTGIEPSELGF